MEKQFPSFSDILLYGFVGFIFIVGGLGLAFIAYGMLDVIISDIIATRKRNRRN
jgi:hypothetical protein